MDQKEKPGTSAELLVVFKKYPHLLTSLERASLRPTKGGFPFSWDVADWRASLVFFMYIQRPVLCSSLRNPLRRVLNTSAVAGNECSSGRLVGPGCWSLEVRFYRLMRFPVLSLLRVCSKRYELSALCSSHHPATGPRGNGYGAEGDIFFR